MRVTGTGVDLFTMQSARVGPPPPSRPVRPSVDQVHPEAEECEGGPGGPALHQGLLQVPRHVPCQGDTTPRLKTGLHQATLALAEAIPGPQDVELELLMEMYYMVPAHNCLS